MSKNNNCPPCKKTSIGGQALLEGIMMRGPKRTAMAVRDQNGEIVIEDWRNETKERSKITKLPFFRGVFNLIDSLSLGYKCLMRSAEISGLEEAEAELAREKEEKKRQKAAKKAAKKGISVEETLTETEPVEASATTAETENNDNDEPKSEEKKDKDKGQSSFTNGIMAISMILGVGLAVLLFIYLPTFFSTLILGKNAAVEHPILLTVISGGFKVIILVAYMSLVLLMKDIKRTFMYHGAEHKSIFCYEQGLELTVENVRKQRRFHPRCGTSFLFLMIIVSVVVMIPIGMLLRAVLPEAVLASKALFTLIRTGIAVVLLPLMAGIGYELIRLAGRHDNLLTRIISAPGLWMQRITTKEPDDSMIECAIAALKAVIPDDESDRW